MSRLAIYHASKRRVWIQKICGYALASKICDFCNNIPINHYRRNPLPGSNVVIENEELDICELASHFECREKWGAAEDFSNWWIKRKNLFKIKFKIIIS